MIEGVSCSLEAAMTMITTIENLVGERVILHIKRKVPRHMKLVVKDVQRQPESLTRDQMYSMQASSSKIKEPANFDLMTRPEFQALTKPG